jgi:hypothetical protein
MPVLTAPHERALTLLFSELESVAAGQPEAFLGTPGMLADRVNDNGTKYWVHRYSDAVGRRVEKYIGKLDDPKIQPYVEALRSRIESANATIAQVRILARAGFVTVDRKAYSALASLHNHGVFRAGALLIGSHAYGTLINALGVKAVAYSTEDVDIARREALALSDVPTVAVPELKAHAKGLPYLAYLLGASQEVPILSPHGVVLVRVPVPERYAIHKLIVAQLRDKTSARPEKDLRQAATLIEAVVERYPGAVEGALAAVPKSAGRLIRQGKEALKRHLPDSAEAAWEALGQ